VQAHPVERAVGVDNGFQPHYGINCHRRHDSPPLVNHDEPVGWDSFKFGDYPGVLGIAYLCRLTGNPPTIRVCSSSGSVSPVRLIDAELYPNPLR
jgi:hypothetical protein